MKTAFFLAVIAGLLAGCATTPRPAPMTLAEVISMTKAGATDQEIIDRINASRTVFRLGSEDVVHLRKEGVGEPVVNYMLDTYTRAVAAEQARRDYDYYESYHYYYPWGHPYPWRWRHW